jgi:hypothetical protein
VSLVASVAPEQKKRRPGQSKKPKAEHRVVRVPLRMFPVPPRGSSEPDVWRDLRRAALFAATYGNARLSEYYVSSRAASRKVDMPEWGTVYTDYADTLSAVVRDAIDREAQGIWQRIGKDVFRGAQTVARFQAGRSLVFRDRGVKLMQTPPTKESKGRPGYTVALRVFPRKVNPLPHEFEVFGPALAKDPYLARLLGKLWRKEDGHAITKATLVFERPGRKIFLLLSYSKPVVQVDSKKVVCTVEWNEERGLHLRCEGREISLNDHIHRLRVMKRNFEGIHKRLKHDLAKARRFHAYRGALVKAGTFTTWSRGPLHDLSKKVVDWAVLQKAGNIEWRVPPMKDAARDDQAPWQRIAQLVEYKARDAGVAFVGKVEDEKEAE